MLTFNIIVDLWIFNKIGRMSYEFKDKSFVYMVLFSSLIGMSFNDNRSSHALMATFENSSPANNFESYGDNGFTYKVVYERPFIDYSNLRYNIGWQNIRFSEYVIGYEDWWFTNKRRFKSKFI